MIKKTVEVDVTVLLKWISNLEERIRELEDHSQYWCDDNGYPFYSPLHPTQIGMGDGSTLKDQVAELKADYIKQITL